MAGEKYIVATGENSVQISVRNILNPGGYIFIATCSDGLSLLKLIRMYSPDFVIVDFNMHIRDLRPAVETIDDDMMCALIVISDDRGLSLSGLLEKSKSLTYCPKPFSRELLIHTVEMALVNYRRISKMAKKLKDMQVNFETKRYVDEAKSILMKRDGIGENQAYERIRKKSMNIRRSMKEVAQAIISENGK